MCFPPASLLLSCERLFAPESVRFSELINSCNDCGSAACYTGIKLTNQSLQQQMCWHAAHAVHDPASIVLPTPTSVKLALYSSSSVFRFLLTMASADIRKEQSRKNYLGLSRPFRPLHPFASLPFSYVFPLSLSFSPPRSRIVKSS